MSDYRTARQDATEAAAYRYGDRLPIESRMLEELLKGTEIQQLFETYYKLIKIPVAIIDLKGNVLFSSRWQRICTQFHRVHPDTCRRCVESDTTIATQLTRGRQYAVFPCQNGLTDCASPIVIDGKHVANVFIGQFMTQSPDEARFRRQAAEFGFPVEDYLAAAKEVPVVDEARVPLILDLLARMTRVITSLSVERKRAAEAHASQTVILNSIQPDEQGVSGISAFSKDIADRKLAAERLAVATRAAKIGIWDWDVITNELAWDEGMYALYNIRREDFAGAYAAWASHIHPQDKARVEEDIQAALRGERDYAPEFRIIWPNGEVRSIKAESQTLRDPDGTALRMVGTNIDITERKLAKKELEDSVARFNQLAEQSRTGTWEVDAAGLYTYVSPVFESVTGYSRERLVGKLHFYDIHPEEGREAFKQGALELFARKEKIAGLHNRIKTSSGDVIWVSTEGLPLLDTAGKFSGYRGSDTDITARKQTEIALRDNELKYRALFETADDAILLFADGKWTDCNKAAARVFGCTREDILGSHPKQFSPPTQPDGKNSMEESVRLIGLAYEGKPQSFNWKHCCLDGTPFFAEVSLNRVDLGAKPHIQAIVRDVTARKLAEEALRESNREILQSQRDAGMGTFVLNIKTGVFTVSETMDEILGMNRSDAHTVETWAALIHPEDRAEMVDYLQNEVIAKRRDADKEYRIIRANDREVRWFYSRGRVELDEHGAPAIFRGTSQDITGRKASESRQALYLSVLKRLGDGDASDELISDILAYISRSLDIEAVGIRIEREGDFPFLAARGYTPEFMEKERTLCGKSATGETLRDKAGNVTLECLCGGVIRGTLGHDLPFVTRGGSLWLNSTSALTSEQVGSVAARLVSFRGRCVDVGFESLALIPLRSKGKVIGLLHLADHRKCRLSAELVEFLEGLGSSIAVVMQRKEEEAAKARLEEEIRQSQKMESVGRLAGGVAHDFNNLLTSMTGYGSLLMRSMAPNDPRREDLAEMLGAAERGAALTQQLLAFSRKQVLNPVVLDLNSSVESTLKMLKRLLGEDIKLKTDLEPAACLIRADVNQIGQVVMNLAVNARDAMPKGGTLRISTRVVNMPEIFFKDKPELQPGPLVSLTVEDTGCGMTNEIMQHIFEPFFTTKEKGKGTGLGLPTVYGIVRQSGGTVQLASEPGKGTAFILYFPQSAAALPAMKMADPAGSAGETSGSGERILLVEDDEALRRLGERVLKEAGYSVSTAMDGKDALAVLEKMGGSVDMVITDVIMPGMTGRELAEAVLARGAARHILFVSGYNEEVLCLQGDPSAETELLPKPFNPDELLCKVAAMLKKTGR